MPNLFLFIPDAGGGTITVTETVGTYSWTGTTSTLAIEIVSTIGSYSWSGTTSSLVIELISNPGTYSWSGTTSSLVIELVSSLGTYSWSGTTSSLLGGILATVGTYGWSGTTSTIISVTVVTETIGTYTWIGVTSSVVGPSGTYLLNTPLTLELSGGLSKVIGVPLISVWDSVGRPSSPKQWQIGFNITTSKLEIWNGSSWIGVTLS